jgi:hypothetical protein
VIERQKIYCFLLTFVFALFVGCNGKVMENNLSDIDIIRIMPTLQEPSLTKDKLTHILEVQEMEFEDVGTILDPEFKIGMTIEKLTSNISNVICGFNYKNHLYVIDYYYSYKDLNVESNFEKVIMLLKDYYGEPYHEKENLHISSVATTIRPSITWAGKWGRWTVNLISIEKDKDGFLIHLKYSSWPDGDILRQFPQQTPKNIKI